MCSIAALGCTKDPVTDHEFGVGQGGGDGEDYSRELRAGNPRERGLVLVFAANLKQVKEVGRGCVDSDEVLGR